MSRDIAAGARVAVDTVVFVHFLEGHEHHGPPAERLFRRLEAGEIRGVASALLLTELLVPLYRAGHARDASGLARRLQQFRHLDIVPVDAEIAAAAARVRAEHGLRTPDAIHAATALVSGCDGIVTRDRDFRRLEPRLRVWMLN